MNKDDLSEAIDGPHWSHGESMEMIATSLESMCSTGPNSTAENIEHAKEYLESIADSLKDIATTLNLIYQHMPS